ncbi:MAG: MoaD/ThiS family protein [Candidatus Heimdallarchaeota archaeon]|nr:MoaD/ThiS family protein [Candidatus Heimdallarchaeota archaeon]
MSIINVITFANIKKIIGEKQFTMEAESVEDLLNKLLELYGKELRDELFDKLGKIKSIYRIIVNGRNINLLDGFQTKLKDEDTLVLMPAIAGG